jgi:hypothetical protein
MAYSLLSATSPSGIRMLQDSTANAGYYDPFGSANRNRTDLYHSLGSTTSRPASSTAASMTSSNGGTASSLLNSLLGQADPSRSMIDTAAVGAKSAADTAYGGMIRNLSRMGVNPNAPRFAATMKDWAAQRAAMEAGARNTAARAGADTAFGRKYNLFQAMKSSEESDKQRAFQAEQNRIGREADNARFVYDQQMAAQARRDAAGQQDRAAKAQLAEAKGYAEALAAAGKGAGSSGGSNSTLREAMAAAKTPTAMPAAPKANYFTTAPRISPAQSSSPAPSLFGGRSYAQSNAESLRSMINDLNQR